MVTLESMSTEYWRNRLEELVRERLFSLYRDAGYEVDDKGNIVEEGEITGEVDWNSYSDKYDALLEIAAEECERLRWEGCDD
jgi:hypothetical protein